MNIVELLRKKKASWNEIKKDFDFPLNNKATWLISLSDNNLTNELLEALSVLDVNFIIKSNNLNNSDFKNIAFIKEWFNSLIWLDFVLCDECENNMTDYFNFGVTPIISKNSHLSSLLSEFNPGKVSWNAYIFKNNNKWEVFYALIRYLENFKFSYDNKALVKNVLDI